MSGVSVEAVGRAMGALLAQEGRTILYRDRATGMDVPLSIPTAAAPDGLLPALVVAGEAVWRDATGKGFGLDIVRDPASLLGYRLRGIRDGSFSAVMLSTMEATAQVAGPGVIVANDLNALWQAASASIEQRSAPEPSTSRSPTP